MHVIDLLLIWIKKCLIFASGLFCMCIHFSTDANFFRKCGFVDKYGWKFLQVMPLKYNLNISTWLNKLMVWECISLEHCVSTVEKKKSLNKCIMWWYRREELSITNSSENNSLTLHGTVTSLHITWNSKNSLHYMEQ